MVGLRAGSSEWAPAEQLLSDRPPLGELRLQHSKVSLNDVAVPGASIAGRSHCPAFRPVIRNRRCAASSRSLERSGTVDRNWKAFPTLCT